MTYHIEAGPVLPPPSPKTRSGGRKRKYPLPDLQPGESFFVPETDERDAEAVRGSLATGIYRIKQADATKQFATRLWVESGVRGIRVWRTA